MSLRITILGSGASSGVPLIGCDCAVCRSDNPKNKRSRVSILVEQGDTTLLIDTSPDLRMQALANRLKTVDAILITHAHADHCHGIDDVRSFNYHRNGVIPLYSNRATLEELSSRFPYVFLPPTPHGWFRAALEPIEITPGQTLRLSDDLSIEPFSQIHGPIESLGVRIGKVAYSTDVNKFPEQSWQYLEKLDLWIVDCLRYEPAPTHAHLDLSLSWIERFRPARAVLTHLNHEFDYDRLLTETPEYVTPAYDGMVIELPS